ncbi:MAG: FtsX-like permease family protein [Phycisphaerales bacterium]|jgi:putative ABC transport system permease protein|nr:FtsX-like permease family protein [Phycisphaerales bacterium]
MKLPAHYSLRNLRRRPWQSAATALGIAIVVFAAVLMLSLSRGLFGRLDVTGSSDNLLMISRKGQNAMFSNIEPSEVVTISSMPNLAVNAAGDPLVSPEILHVSMVRAVAMNSRAKASVSIRGVFPIAFEVHDTVRLSEGRRPTKGTFEILAGAMSHIKLGVPVEMLAVGKDVRFEGSDWTIVGRFTDNESLIESELWIPQDTLMTVMRRRTHSMVVAKFTDAQRADDATKLFSQSGAVEKYFKGWSEREYYGQFTDGLAWVFWLSVVMVCLVSLAGLLIGINTMYTVVINRMKEIATHRILGFSKFDITMSLLTESAIIALLGGMIGSACGMYFDEMPMKLSYGAFRLSVDWLVVSAGMSLALLVGVLGALLPTIKGLRLTIIEALHHD